MENEKICWYRCNYGNPPTKYLKKKEEEKKMIVTIIGSLSCSTKMTECKKYWERFGHKVNSPNDPGLQAMSLLSIQGEWIKKIEEADLIVAIPKELAIEGNGKSRYAMEFGESTTYEMALALQFKKQIIFW